MPFFSIVIPTLNEQRYLPKLLSGLTKQIDKNFEVFVVDGSSDDKTVELANGFKSDLRSLRVLNSKKRNVSYQRNMGAAKSLGEWLVFLDADVKVPPNFLSHMHHLILQNKTASFLTTWMNPDSNKKSDGVLISVANLLLELASFSDKPMLGGYCMIIKRNVFLKVKGFSEQVKFAEDCELAHRLSRKGIKLKVFHEPKFTISLRRMRREGTLEFLRKNALATTKMLFEGPISRELFDYPMGGKVPVKKL